MSGKQKLVNVKLDPEKKREWEQAVEESDEYSTLSHLIRLSVSRELAGLYDQGDGGEGGGVDADVQSQLDELQETVEKIAEQMGTMESEVLSSTDITELADRLYDLIPEFTVVERESRTVPIEELSEDEREKRREEFEAQKARGEIPEAAQLEEVEISPDYEFGEIEPPGDELSASDGMRILDRAADVVDDVEDIDEEVRELDESELRGLTETGLLSVYREYLQVFDYDIHQAAQKLIDEYPRVKMSETASGDEVIYEVTPV